MKKLFSQLIDAINWKTAYPIIQHAVTAIWTTFTAGCATVWEALCTMISTAWDYSIRVLTPPYARLLLFSVLFLLVVRTFNVATIAT